MLHTKPWFADPLEGGIGPSRVAMVTPSSVSAMNRRLPASGPCPHAEVFLPRSRNQALALRLFARELARATDCLVFLARGHVGWLFVEPPALHLAKDAFALHLSFQRLECLVDIVVTDEYLQEITPSWFKNGRAGRREMDRPDGSMMSQQP